MWWAELLRRPRSCYRYNLLWACSAVQVGMMCFMAWMFGNSIQIFSIFMTFNLISAPVSAIMSSGEGARAAVCIMLTSNALSRIRAFNTPDCHWSCCPDVRHPIPVHLVYRT